MNLDDHGADLHGGQEYKIGVSQISHMLHTVVGWPVRPYNLYLKGSRAVLTAIVAEAEEPAVYTLGDNLVDLDGYSPKGRLQRK